MNEEKIDQILKNQTLIMDAQINRCAGSKHKYNITKTEELLNPPKEPSIKEPTEEAFSKKEARSKFGTRRK